MTIRLHIVDRDGNQRLVEPLPAGSLMEVLRDLDGAKMAEHIVLTDPDLDATNTAEQPDRVTPFAGSGATLEAGRLAVELPPRSWNVIRLEVPA